MSPQYRQVIFSLLLLKQSKYSTHILKPNETPETQWCKHFTSYILAFLSPASFLFYFFT